jgi:excisionase family DNA binding protein
MERETMPDGSASERSDSAWLSLQEASALLGVAPSTVRRWGDTGRLETKRTLGGHRRFERAAVERLAAGQRTPQASAQLPAVLAGSWGLDSRAMARQEWHARLASRADAERMRGLGQRLLGLLIQYVNRREEDERFLREARAVGASYGSEAKAAGVSMHDTVEAFLFFRGSFSRLTLPLPGIAQPHDLAQAAELHARMDRFMDAILLGAIDGYER